ncbi:head completion/stabilization protein [Sphingomonas sp. UV9]|uniref:head completion/stabilization protein n=1 Tax=Sphingomonas sp. UV9 TaxID=1851410 RepID=UPI000FFBA145|nr:head completion/stabilization protein [Sphingomonas sp. UV9]RXD02497.1 head completion/stabilization protein [Sphingomonas sp. UV9]
MTGLIATVLPDEDTLPPAIIVNDGFFPDVDPAMFRAQHRIRDAVTTERAREALIAAMLAVYRDLAAWSRGHRAAGLKTLADVRLSDGSISTIDGTNTLVLLYHRAVFTAAKAEVVERYRDVDLTSAGQRKVEDLEPSVTELRRDSIHAIRDMLGVTRTAVELI